MLPVEVCRQLRLEGIFVHPGTISIWAGHYSYMYQYSSALRVDAEQQWHVDEIHFKILKKPDIFLP